MASTAKTPEQILKEAAEAAQQLIPDAERQRDELQRKLAEVEFGLVRLRAVVSALPSITSPLTTTSTTSTTVTSTGALVMTQAAPPSAYLKMHMIFGETRQPLSVREIGEIFKSKFGEDIPQSTLYFALKKGDRKGTFVQESDGRWRLKTKEEKR